MTDPERGNLAVDGALIADYASSRLHRRLLWPGSLG
jgi:hypothetical protein